MDTRILRQLGRLGWPLAAVAAAALVVTLAGQNRTLTDRLDRARQQAAAPHDGLWMPSFTAAATDGAPVTVGEDAAGGRQIVFVFTTSCQFCKASIPAWKTITAAADSMATPDVRVIGVSLDSLPVTTEYVATHDLKFPVVVMPSRKLSALYRARAVPVTYVLDSAGRAIFGRVGVVETRATIDSVLAAARYRRPVAPPVAVVAGQDAGKPRSERPIMAPPREPGP